MRRAKEFERELEMFRWEVDAGTQFFYAWLNETAWYKDQCDYILQKFIASASGMQGFRESAGELDYWMLGRRFGLLSPFLDWTTSPFVAAFFALEVIYRRFAGLRSHYPMQYKGNIHVWGLRFWDAISEADVFEVAQGTTIHGTRPRAQRATFKGVTGTLSRGRCAPLRRSKTFGSGTTGVTVSTVTAQRKRTSCGWQGPSDLRPKVSPAAGSQADIRVDATGQRAHDPWRRG
jgi:FRG domain